MLNLDTHVLLHAVGGKLDVSIDPADELIAATSLVHNVPLVTRDRKMLSSRWVPLA